MAQVQHPTLQRPPAKKNDPKDYSRTVQMMMRGTVFTEYLPVGKKETFMFFAASEVYFAIA